MARPVACGRRQVAVDEWQVFGSFWRLIWRIGRTAYRVALVLASCC